MNRDFCGSHSSLNKVVDDFAGIVNRKFDKCVITTIFLNEDFCIHVDIHKKINHLQSVVIPLDMDRFSWFSKTSNQLVTFFDFLQHS